MTGRGFLTLFVVAALATVGRAGNGEQEKDDTRSVSYGPPPIYDPVPPVYIAPAKPAFYGVPPPSFLPRPVNPPVNTPPVLPPRPPPVDASRVCDTVRCNPPSTCRAVQVCPTCRPQPACILRGQLPPGVDTVCRQVSGRSVLLFSVLQQRVTPLRCLPWARQAPRGGCPLGSSCVPAGTPDFPLAVGVCCLPNAPVPNPGPLPPQGGPPTVPSGGPPTVLSGGPPPITSGAAHVPPDSSNPWVQRPGTCPQVMVHPSSCAGPSCRSDGQCPPLEKCCPNACGGTTCTAPSRPPPPQQSWPTATTG